MSIWRRHPPPGVGGGGPRPKRPWIRPETVYLALAVLAGPFFILVTPPFQTPDEYNHVKRIYQISAGGWLAERQPDRLGGRVPASLITAMGRVSRDLPFHPEKRQRPEDIVRLLDQPLRPEVLEFTDFPNTALYAPVAYLPQAAVVALGRKLELAPLMLVWLARAAAWTAATTLTALALRRLPFGGWTIALLALMPMTMAQSASAGADGITIALALTYVSLTCRFAFGPGERPLGAGAVAGLALVGGLLAVAKLAYAPLVLLAGIIPGARFGSRRNQAAALLMVMGAGAAMCALWAVPVHNLYVPYEEYDPANRPGTSLLPGVDPDRQLHVVLAHPGRFLWAAFEWLWGWPDWLAHTLVGRLGWTDTALPSWLVGGYLVLLGLVAAGEGRGGIRLAPRQRLLLLLAPSLSFLAVTFLLYLSWTEIGAAHVNGLQGRYFLPFLAPLLLLPSPRRGWLPGRLVPVLAAGGAALALAVTGVRVVERYYTGPAETPSAAAFSAPTPVPAASDPLSATDPVPRPARPGVRILQQHPAPVPADDPAEPGATASLP